jgi:hypothetical protein
LHTAKVGWTGRGMLLPSLALFSFLLPLLSFLPPHFSFSPFSLYPVHSLSETPLNCHRNVYVKLTPQSGQLLKTIRIFWSHRWTVYRNFSLYYILKMCILFGIGIRTNFQNSKLLNLANFCEESWHTPLQYMVCAAIANVS